MPPPHAPLISSAGLATLLQAPRGPLLLIDTSFDLGDLQAGPRSYAAAHLPGAVYLHLENHLSGARTGHNGRHPLPERRQFVELMADCGADDDTLIVAYDNAGGMYAARLWWMLRWAGHAAASVLDGGIGAWRAAGNAVEPGVSRTAGVSAAGRGNFSLRPPLTCTVDFAALLAGLAHGRHLIVDARSSERYRGENETIDPVAGHIPGAINRPFRDNLRTDGTFKPAAALRAEWLTLLGGRAIGEVVNQCGSGVTACHNLLALEVAGFGGSALYPGSWSEWCAQPGAPVATGSAA
jgi:thiosulfate/3-mercaptopyruvate sulfurtransferase